MTLRTVLAETIDAVGAGVNGASTVLHLGKPGGLVGCAVERGRLLTGAYRIGSVV